MKKTLSYDKAMEELQSISSRLQDGEISLDKLSEQIKRAGELIAFCKQKLRTAEEELDKIFQDNN